MTKIIRQFNLMNFFAIAFIMLLFGCDNPRLDYQTGNQVPNNHIYDDLLNKHVNDLGEVNYQGFIKDSIIFNQYLDELKANPPDTTLWSRETQIAYWINAYNAFTIKLIIDNYPVKSIKDLNPTISAPFINSVWDVKFIELGEEKISLNNIEHDILRSYFNEPRIHFAINCASISCPRLLNTSFTAEKLEMMLETQTKEFINDVAKNKIDREVIEVSKIFFWFGGDFKTDGTLIDFLNRYADVKIEKSADIDYMAYNWLLNGK